LEQNYRSSASYFKFVIRKTGEETMDFDPENEKRPVKKRPQEKNF
jgi:hypothetical protein